MDTSPTPAHRPDTMDRNALALELLTEHTPVAIAFLDRSLTYLATSRRYLRALHLEVDSIVGRHHYEIFPSISEPRKEMLRRCLAGENHRSDEETFRLPNGLVEWVSWEISPWYERDGAVGGLVIQGEIITARKRAEDALRESEARYRSLFETMAQGVVYHDASGAILEANPAAERILGLTVEQLLGRFSTDPRWRAIHEDGSDFPGETHPVIEALRTGREVRDVVMGVHHPPTDSVRWLNIRGVPRLRPGETAPTQAYAVFSDITEQRQAAQSLEYERHQLAAILDTLHEGVIAFRPDGAIALINPAALRLLRLETKPRPETLAELWQMSGVTPVDARGELLPDEARPSSRVLRGETLTGVVLRMRTSVPGKDRWFAHAGTPVRDERREVILGVLTLQDVTARKRDEAALQARTEELGRNNAELARALRMKDEFLAMMSHELRSPLHAVLGVTEALGEELYGPLTARQRSALDRVTHSGRHLLSILSDILDLAQIGAGTATLGRAPVDVEHLCRAALQMVHAAAQDKGIRLLRSVEQGVEGLHADERRLTQILVNLLDNAVKFTPAGGTVSLEVTGDRGAEQIRFLVRDTGIGIAPADQGRLFEPFTQVDGRLSRQYGGVGLGLSLVRRLVEMHGGSVHVESTPGEGSRFVVSLSWSPSDNSPTVAGKEPAAPAFEKPPRVLVADDDDLGLDAQVELLRSHGCEVSVARDGAEAITQVRAARPDVVVMDIHMPGMDGLTAIRHLRGDPGSADLPILALTALVTPGDRERCLAAGADRYLAKPVSVRALLGAIAEVLKT